MINELIKYKIAIAAIQETRWNKFTPQHLYIGKPAVLPIIMNSFGTAFLVDSKFNMVENFTPIKERLRVIRTKGRFFNYSLINIHAPLYQQMTQKRRARINFMNSWSEHTQPAQEPKS
jgi:hypothetical protein